MRLVPLSTSMRVSSPEANETGVSLRSHMKRSVKFLLFLCLVYPVI